ncbi:MAG: hypothetical protein JST11_04585 [Acidobacteria bacterium]|nr:hypothetical protein [Acidobacteriota bacterium]
MRRLGWWSAVLLLAAAGQAAVRSVEIAERGVILNGRTMGGAGAYERIRGTVHFALDPKAAANSGVRGLPLAATDADGLVECSAEFYLLKPVDAAKGNGTVLFEVSNRGGRGMLSRFDFARAGQEFGDDWLLEQGYTLAWLGWEWDLPAANRDLLHFTAPRFRADALPARGLVRSEFVADRTVTSFSLGDRNQIPVALGRAVGLFAADSSGRATAIPASKWRLTADRTSVEMAGGFEPGQLYEFVYEGKDPVVAGAGLAAIRDWISFLKFGGADPALGDLYKSGKRAIGFGISQSGRLLREFLYDGFNADERGRRVFDGVWADVGGAGRGSFNFRYAQPSRDGWPYLNIFYPTDVFPFTDTDETDPASGRRDGLLARARRANVVPKLFLTNNSSEYWGRAAALVHVTADGAKDAALDANTRCYFLAGVQHIPGSLPLTRQGTRYERNPVDHRPVQRALLAAMQAWLKDGKAPPESVYPTLRAGELTRLDGLRFPRIPDGAGVVETPGYPRVARRLDFGPDFATQGIATREPPAIEGAYPVLVPQVDADGIDLGGIRLPELAAPLATVTGWNLRAPERGAPEQLAEFYGAMFPFPKTKADRERTGDPRLSVLERYPNREEYIKQAGAAAGELVRRGFVLPRDREYVIDRAARLWDALMP